MQASKHAGAAAAAVAPRRERRARATGILNPAFHYTPSHATDLRKTFERVRRELAQQQLFAAGKDAV